MKLFSKILFVFLSSFFTAQSIVAEESTPVQLDKVTVEYVVTTATVAPLREEPSYAGEQATQLLFGEVCEVLERFQSWTKVRSTIDGQVGWVNRTMLAAMPDSHITTLSDSHIAVVVTPMASATPIQGGAPLLLTLGTCLSNYMDGTFHVLDQTYSIDPACVKVYELSNNDVLQQRSDLIRFAKSLLNTPYLWGGKNAMGLDCSGFTQVVYAAVGISILRNAREQITQGELVSSLSDVLPGDLAFFDQDDCDPNDMRVTHVGLLLSPTEIIHCAGGCVHIDRIEADGIYMHNGSKTHQLIQIKRYL